MTFRSEHLLACMLCQGGGDTGVEGHSVVQMPNYIHTPTGDSPVWLEISVDDDGNRTEQYFYTDINGDTIMTTGANIGMNTVPEKTQFVGNFHKDYFANGADLTVTAADILADVVAAGLVLQGPAGATQAATAADFIANIEVSLKLVGGHGDDAGTQVTATAADGTMQTGGGVTDIDPAGERVAGVHIGDFLRKSSFEEFTILAGSIAVVSVDIATIEA